MSDGQVAQRVPFVALRRRHDGNDHVGAVGAATTDERPLVFRPASSPMTRMLAEVLQFSVVSVVSCCVLMLRLRGGGLPPIRSA